MQENYDAFFTEASGFLNERVFKDYLRRLDMALMHHVIAISLK
ncbi:hypothetical protein Kyoto142A_12830 [Helicobacter pylori]